MSRYGSASRYLLEVIKIFYRHRDIILRGKEKTVGDLAPVLRVGGLGLRVVVVVLEPRLRLRLVDPAPPCRRCLEAPCPTCNR